jgi:hypothetical protein
MPHPGTALESSTPAAVGQQADAVDPHGGGDAGRGAFRRRRAILGHRTWEEFLADRKA